MSDWRKENSGILPEGHSESWASAQPDLVRKKSAAKIEARRALLQKEAAELWEDRKRTQESFRSVSARLAKTFADAMLTWLGWYSWGNTKRFIERWEMVIGLWQIGALRGRIARNGRAISVSFHPLQSFRNTVLSLRVPPRNSSKTYDE